MATRQLRFEGDEILRKRSREIDVIDEKIKTLAEDMIETMYKEEGVGLAGPQIGMLKRIIVIDIGEGPIVAINPVIASQDGEEIDIEGCLSVPGKSGKVSRPYVVRVEYTDLDGEAKSMEAEGFLARAFCHEIDHLNGVLYIDKLVEGE